MPMNRTEGLKAMQQTNHSQLASKQTQTAQNCQA